jgi:HD-GYP domain-containing protein (c-di-GMP phosphodiesterase class II)
MNKAVMTENIHEFIRHLLSSSAAAGLYGMSHQQVQRLVGVAYASLSKALAVRPDIAMLEVNGELVIDAEPQPFSLVLERFARMLQDNGIGHLRFLAGVSLDELTSFIGTLSQQTENPLGSGEYIRVGRVELPEQGDDVGSLGAGSTGSGSGQISLEELSGVELARLTEVYEAIKRNERLKPSGIATTVAELLEAFRREGEALLVMAALREKDEYTFTHNANVSILVMAQAMSLGIKGQLLNDIGMAAMLHDIGKMFVPDEILTKPGKLTDEEFTIMKRHPVKGARYLLETPGVPRLAAIVAYEHHMRDNLSGYPAAPRGWRLNLASQMTSIADVFDAMRTRRPYQPPRDTDEIANLLLSKADTEFPQPLVQNFLLLLDRRKQSS